MLRILAHASGAGATVAMPDGKGGTATLPIPNGAQWFEYNAMHTSFALQSGDAIVFTNTDAYFVEVESPTGV